MISIGLDVGHDQDPAALAVLQSTGTRPESHRPLWQALEVGNIELGTSYQALATITCDLATDFQQAGYPVVVTIDTTGVGGPVVELARTHAPDLHIVALTIGADRCLTQNGPDEYTVGKHRLTEVLQVALEQRGLELPDSAGGQLAAEQIRQFVKKINPRTGHAKHEAAGAGHDDIVLAIELAMWTGDLMYDQQAGVAP